jgi:hypothetical protein
MLLSPKEGETSPTLPTADINYFVGAVQIIKIEIGGSNLP